MKLEFDQDGNLKLQKSSNKLSELKAKNLDFLKDECYKKPEREFWNLHVDGAEVDPLAFSNGKTQEDIVKEIVSLIKDGSKTIFLKGACGTGKSAIALNLARLLGKTSIIVPIKNLQRQYEEDYTSKKFLVKSDGIRLKIAVLTGRDNHASRFITGESCAYPLLPENIDLREERNWKRLKEYFDMNPNNNGRIMPDLWKLKRFMIAPANPYWSPILGAEADPNIDYSEKIEYDGADGNKCAFYWRKKGCGYYDQYAAYAKADVLVFNSAKYMSEIAASRKPATELEIFDEGDEFLDKLFHQKMINLNRLSLSLTALPLSSDESKAVIRDMTELIRMEVKNKRILGIDRSKIYNIKETKIKDLLKLFRASGEVNYEISMDSNSYANKALGAAVDFKDVIDDVYLNYSMKDGELYIHMACTNIAAKIENIKKLSKVLIFMSGTLHSEKILRKVFGFEKFEVVEAETVNPGSANSVKFGKEFKCDYRNMKNNRESYLRALNTCVVKAKPPVLVQIGAFSDLPSKEEKEKCALDVISSKEIKLIQMKDKLGKNVIDFKAGLSEILYSTRTNRGMDFPGETCNSVIFTKYPYPNVSDVFWKVLKKTHPEIYMEFYLDKAHRELQQRLYRALRFEEDHVFVLSPDTRVLNAVGKLPFKSKKPEDIYPSND